MAWVKRAAWLLVGLALAYGAYRAAGSYFASRQPQQTPYATAVVGRGTVTETVADPGVIASATTSDVASAASGHVQTLAAVGQLVQAGDPVAEISDDQGLGAAVASAQANLIQAQAQLAADLNPALNVTEAQVEAAALAVEQAKLAMAQQQIQVDRLTVAAPFSGLVSDVGVSPGQVVAAGQVLLAEVDDCQVEVIVPVREDLAPGIAIGGPATVTIPATGATVSGQIVQLGDGPGASIASGLPVTIVLDHVPTGVLAGMAALATITPTGPAARVATGPISATGVVTFPATAAVIAQQPGTVASIAAIGQRVSAGSALVVLANANLQAQLQQAAISVQASQASLDALAHPQPVAEATITAQRAQVEALAQALSLRQRAYATLTVTAPFAGQVAAVNTVVGAAVGQGAPLVSLLDPAHLEAQVAVDELDVAKVKVGQAVQVSVAALGGQPLAGQVTAIAATAVVSSGVSTYQGTVSLPQNPELRVGMSVQASIAIAGVSDVVRIPAEAVQAAAGQAFVWVPGQQGGSPVQKGIQTGVEGDAWTEVRSGLAPGDVIVVAQAQNSANPSNIQRAATQFSGGGRTGGGGSGH